MFKWLNRRWQAGVRVFVVCLLCLAVTGCWDSSEIDELAIVLASGLDVSNSSSNLSSSSSTSSSSGSDASSQQTILGSAQIAIPRLLGSTQGGGPASSTLKPFLVESAMGRDPADCIEGVRKKIARKLILSHRQVVVVGEEYAKQGVKTLLDEILRNPGSRLRTSFVVGFHSDALPILMLPRELTRVPSEAVEGLEEQFGFENYSVKDFMEELTGKGDPYTLGIEPVSTQSNETPKTFLLHNVAVFQKDKLVGWLEKQQLPGFLWMIDRMKSGITSLNIPNERGTVSVKLLRSHVARKVHIVHGKPQISINVQIEDDVIENGTAIDLHSPKGVAVVESAAAKKAENEMRSTLDMLQHKYHADILGFGDLIYERSPGAWHKIEKNWREEFTNLPVQFDTQVQIRRSGLMSSNLVISG